MSSESEVKEPFIHRYSWVVFLVISVLFVLFGIGDVILGTNADPAIVESITGIEWDVLQAASHDVATFINLSARMLGLTLLCFSLLTVAITLTSFRQGHTWAWYALWIWPIWYASLFILTFTAERSPDFPPPPPMMSAPIFFLITALTLLLSYRRFFPGSPNQ